MSNSMSLPDSSDFLVLIECGLDMGKLEGLTFIDKLNQAVPIVTFASMGKGTTAFMASYSMAIDGGFTLFQLMSSYKKFCYVLYCICGPSEDEDDAAEEFDPLVGY